MRRSTAISAIYLPDILIVPKGGDYAIRTPSPPRSVFISGDLPALGFELREWLPSLQTALRSPCCRSVRAQSFLTAEVWAHASARWHLCHRCWALAAPAMASVCLAHLVVWMCLQFPWNPSWDRSCCAERTPHPRRTHRPQGSRDGFTRRAPCPAHLAALRRVAGSAHPFPQMTAPWPRVVDAVAQGRWLAGTPHWEPGGWFGQRAHLPAKLSLYLIPQTVTEYARHLRPTFVV